METLDLELSLMDAHSFIDFLKLVDIWLLFTAHESTLTSLSKEELGFPCG